MSDTEIAQLQAKLDCEHQIALEAEEMREAAVLECEQQRQRADEAERALAEANRQISNLSRNFKNTVEHNLRLQQNRRQALSFYAKVKASHKRCMQDLETVSDCVEARAVVAARCINEIADALDQHVLF